MSNSRRAMMEVNDDNDNDDNGEEYNPILPLTSKLSSSSASSSSQTEPEEPEDNSVIDKFDPSIIGNNSSSLSLQDLLHELDIRNIRYSPSAKRVELEQLLLLHRPLASSSSSSETTTSDTLTIPSIDSPIKRTIEPGKSMKDNEDDPNEKSSDSSRRRNKPVSELTLAQLLEQLNAQGIRYLPTATRTELENLLRPRTSKVKQNGLDANNNAKVESNPFFRQKESTTSSKRSSEKAKVLNLFLSELLGRLDDVGIRYPPTASRTDLEELLLAHQRNLKKQETGETILTQGLDSNAPPIETTPQKSQTNRRELDSRDSIAEERQRRRERRRRRQENTRPPLRKIFSKTSTTTLSASKGLSRQAVRIGEKAVRQLGRVAEQAQKLLELDDEDEDEGTLPKKDNEIRDVDFYYVHKYDDDEPIDVTIEPIESKWRNYQTSSRRENPPSASTRRSQPFDIRAENDRDSFEQRRARVDGNRRSGRANDVKVPPSPPTQRRRPLFQLPAANDGTIGQNREVPTGASSVDRDGRRRRRSRTSESSGQRIYSPYGTVEEGDFNGRDAFDRFGDFVAKAAEDALWGAEEESSRPESREESRRTNASRKSPPKSAQRRKTTSGTKTPETVGSHSVRSAQHKARNAAGTNKGRKRHWKDRLAESLDYLLGLHEDGAYYNSWQKQLELDREDDGDYDALSVAQGRAPKRKKKPHFDKPIWEEEGNLISLLFGRTQSGNSLLFERVLDRNSGSLLNLISSAGRSFLIVASYLFRWASVRGALPQSVVVVGVVSAGICARAKNRLRNMIFTLLVLRTFGEVIHGYVYGDSDWAEENESEDDEES